MSRTSSIEALGGQEWEQLGIYQESHHRAATVDEELDWETLLPCLVHVEGQPPNHLLRLCIISLDALGDPEEAFGFIEQAEEDTPTRKGLSYQLAVQLRSLDLLNKWQDGVALETDERRREHLTAVAHFARIMLCGDKQHDEAWESSDPSVQLGYQILLSINQRWSDLAAALKQSDDVSTLLAAHVYGDILGRYEKQSELLQQVANSEPLFAGETLLELAFKGEGGEGLTQALARRHTMLSAMASSISEACATGAMLQLSGAKAPDTERPDLKDAQAVVAWRHLNALLERQNAAKEPGKLAFLYLEEAKGLRTAMSYALRLRAAELMMAQNVWGRALRVLPEKVKGQPIIAQLSQRYRVLCYGQLQSWDKLARVLIQLATSAATPEERVLLLQFSILAAMRKPEEAPALLHLVHGQLGQLDDDGVRTLAWALMPAFRAVDDHERVASLWSTLYDRAGNDEEAALACFALGVAQLKAGRVDLAQAAFNLAREKGGKTPTTLAAQAITLASNKRWPEVVEALAELAATATDDAAVQLLRQAAYYAVVRAGDVERGRELTLLALERQPVNLALLQEAAAIQMRLGKYEEVAGMLERAVAAADDQAEQTNLLSALGELRQLRLDDLPAAEEAYRQALELHPLHPNSIRGLCRLLVKAKRYQDLPPLLYSLLQLAETDSARLKLLLELATLHMKLWEKGKSSANADDCIKCCDRALELDPENEDATKRLVAICEKLGRWQEIIDRIAVDAASLPGLRGLLRAFEATSQWERMAQVSRHLAERAISTRERLSAALRAGDIYQKELGDLERAEACFRWASERFKDRAPLRRLAELLRPLNRAADLVEVLERELEATERDKRLPIHLELGQLHAGPLARSRSAIQHFEAAVEIDPASEEALRTLERLHEQEKSFTDLARVLEKLLNIVDETPDELRVALKLGGVYGSLKDERSMLRMATRVRRQFPNDPKAIAFAEEVYRRQERHSDLCELYERRIQLLESEPGSEGEIAELLERKGNLELSKMGAPAEAVESLTRVVELRPEDADTLNLLERVLSEAGDWQRLMSVYEKRANNLKVREDQVNSLQRAARIAAQQLHDEAEAVRLYERIHGLDPTDAESFSFLERKLERRNDFKRLVDLLLDRAERVEAQQDKVDCIVRAASICEQLNDVPRAKELYQRAHRLEPLSRRALESLARIYESQEAWKEFIEVTRKQIKLETKASSKALLFFKCGSVVETKYQQEKEAAKYYTQAIKTSPSCLPAIHSLRELYARRQNWKKVLDTLTMESNIWSDDKGRADVLSQIAEIYATKLNDTSKALYYYRKAIETHSENMPAALALFEACANQGYYTEAVAWGDVYARQVQKKGSQAQRADFFVRWADVLRRVGRYKEAAKYLVRALGLRPGQKDALYGLLDLCRESPDCYDFSKAFADLLKDANKREDTMAQAIVSTSLGVLAEHRSDINASLELYRQAIKTSGDHVRLARPLADLLVLLGQEDEAVELLERCRQRGKETTVSEWIEAVLWLVDHEIIWSQDYGRAVALCREALDEQPNRADVRLRLARAESLLSRPELAQVEYQQICDQLAKQGMDPQQLARRWHALGLAAYKAGNHSVAESSWRRAHELSPEWPFSYLAMVRSSLSRGDERAAVGAMHQAAEALPAELPDLLRTQADLLANQGVPERSIELYERLTASSHPEISDQIQLARLLLRSGDTARSVEVLLEIVRSQLDYVPALEELELAWTSTGEHVRARRAGQVVDLALGNGAGSGVTTAVGGPLSKEVWAKLSEPLSRHPLEPLWQLVREPMLKIHPVAQPRSVTLGRAEVDAASGEMAPLFGRPLEVLAAKDPGPLWRLFSKWLILAPEASELGVPELRFLLGMGYSAAKSGHEILMRYGPEQRQEVARVLGSVLLPEGQRPNTCKALVGMLSRREQRQVAKLASQHTTEQAGAEELANSWIGAVERVGIQVSLLITDELGALVRILALQQGFPAAWLGQGGLLTALPDLDPIIEYYLSDVFHQTRVAM